MNTIDIKEQHALALAAYEASLRGFQGKPMTKIPTEEEIERAVLDRMSEMAVEKYRTRHGKDPSAEQIASWRASNAAKRKREAEQIDLAEKERETEKRICRNGVETLESSAFGSSFSQKEKDAIKWYYERGDWRGARDKGTYAAISVLERLLRKQGIEIERVSQSEHDGASKSLYVKIGEQLVRVSDHELPDTPMREYNHSQGLTGRWDREVIIRG